MQVLEEAEPVASVSIEVDEPDLRASACTSTSGRGVGRQRCFSGRQVQEPPKKCLSGDEISIETGFPEAIPQEVGDLYRDRWVYLRKLVHDERRVIVDSATTSSAFAVARQVCK